MFCFTEKIKPVPLATGDFEVGGGIKVTVSGWGTTSDISTEISERLNYVQLTTITNKECAIIYGPDVVVSSTLCAVGNPHHSICYVSHHGN